MWYYSWGCRRSLNFITHGSERVRRQCIDAYTLFPYADYKILSPRSLLQPPIKHIPLSISRVFESSKTSNVCQSPSFVQWESPTPLGSPHDLDGRFCLMAQTLLCKTHSRLEKHSFLATQSYYQCFSGKITPWRMRFCSTLYWTYHIQIEDKSRKKW